ncbi:SDR family NAD(P)-dependent oxidoreductase [Novosphingobium profundi]|uniref:SDR family oxidoreductase n=1 Tax=Novosphingobium profundi TaxID=1774954 RepID=UPI001BDAE3A4|nr:SDR family NAD(P)-dependent oxidoreductase [Novosphingobium profundi]MBT0669145.1 SDR family NAD(P)-dependent oxidoreductase [Novosphingobium profundi]
MQFVNRKILITGGNSGIGRALAEALVAAGNTLIVTGRKAETLKATLEANPAMSGYELDVTDTASLAAFTKAVLADHPDLDAVILNAGIMEAEDYAADPVSTEVADRIVATNLTAPIHMAAAFLPHLRARAEAALVTVSSGLAFLPLARTPVYSASKAAIHSFTQSLRHQLRDTSVAVHEIAPPEVATELTPGQSQRPTALPLEAFITEVTAIMTQDDVPDEILVERVAFLRQAEREGQFAERFAMLNG